jgi:predicted ester cyclase
MARIGERAGQEEPYVGREEQGKGTPPIREAFGGGKTEVVDEVLDPDFVCYDPNAEGGEVRGLETIKGEIEDFRQAFPEDFFWRVEEQLVEGDKVTTRYTLGGTHQGEFFGVPATGRWGGDKRDQYRPG